MCVRAAREWLLACMRVLLVSVTNKTLTHITVFLSVRSVHRTERVVNADNGDYLSLKHDDPLSPHTKWHLYGGPLRSCRRFIFHSTCARQPCLRSHVELDVRTYMWLTCARGVKNKSTA